MGKIKKILENELVGGTKTTDVYPVTSVKAVYDENNKRLDIILDNILEVSQTKLTELERRLSETINANKTQTDTKLTKLESEVIYDVTANNNGAVFESLLSLLNSDNLSTLIPTSVMHGGISLRFVQSSDNKYVEYRLTAPTWSTDINDWTSEDPYFIDMVMQEVNEAIKSNTPIVIQGDVTNAPDEEDLTRVNQEGIDVLKFKDKAYIPITYSGMGRVYLRKNMVNGVNTLTQDMFYKGEIGSREPNTNTVFVIQYDYEIDSNNNTITVPANCVLEFCGGSLRNGTIIGQNTAIISPIVKIFNTTANIGETTVTLSGLKLSGTWSIEGIYPEYFGAFGDGINNDTNAIQCATTLAATINKPVCFLGKKYLVDSIILPSNIHYKGLCGYSQFGSIQKTVIETNNSTAHTMFLCSSSICNLNFCNIYFKGGSRCTFIDVTLKGSCIKDCVINDFHDVFVKDLKTTTILNNLIQTVHGVCFSFLTDCYITLNYLSGYRVSQDDTILFGSASTSSIENNYIDYFKYVFRRGEWNSNVIGNNQIEYCYRVIDAVTGRFVNNIFHDNRATHITDNDITILNEEMQNIAPASIIAGILNSDWEISSPQINFRNNIISNNIFDGKIDIWTSNPSKNNLVNNNYQKEELIQISIIDSTKGSYVDFYEGKEIPDSIILNKYFNSNMPRPIQSYYVGMKGLCKGNEIFMSDADGNFTDSFGDQIVFGFKEDAYFISIYNSLQDAIILKCAYVKYKNRKQCLGNIGESYSYTANNWRIATEPVVIGDKTTAKFHIEDDVTRATNVYWIDVDNKVLSKQSVSRTTTINVPENAAYLIFDLDPRTTPDKVRLYLE